MTVINEIKKILESIPAGKPFTAKTFRHAASADNIKKILSRLTKEGVIERSSRGVYIKLKHIAKVGPLAPSIKEIAKVLTEATGETIMMHGAEAARQFNLTTQVPMRLIFYTNGKSRSLTIGKHTVELRHVNPSRLIAVGTRVGTAVSALNYLGRENVNDDVIDTIYSQLSRKEIALLLKQVENMPAWMADAFYHHKIRGEGDE